MPTLADIVLLADGDHMDFDNGWWIVMGIGMILFWALVIVGIVWLVRELADRSRGAAHATAGPSPLELLDRRFAEGEISVEEYEERRQVLDRQR